MCETYEEHTSVLLVKSSRRKVDVRPGTANVLSAHCIGSVFATLHGNALSGKRQDKDSCHCCFSLGMTDCLNNKHN